ncbi:hypothetical protein OFM15_26710, partial [Escherichia coli]|nr:hypothetical protein [Escherichia coli]
LISAALLIQSIFPLPLSPSHGYYPTLNRTRRAWQADISPLCWQNFFFFFLNGGFGDLYKTTSEHLLKVRGNTYLQVEFF